MPVSRNSSTISRRRQDTLLSIRFRRSDRASGDDHLLELERQAAPGLSKVSEASAKPSGLPVGAGKMTSWEERLRSGAYSASQDPLDGVGNVALTAAVRADDRGHAGPELELVRSANVLSEQLQPFKMHPYYPCRCRRRHRCGSATRPAVRAETDTGLAAVIDVDFEEGRHGNQVNAVGAT